MASVETCTGTGARCDPPDRTERAHLLGTSKRGDTYLRTLLVHRARSSVAAAVRESVLNSATAVPQCHPVIISMVTMGNGIQRRFLRQAGSWAECGRGKSSQFRTAVGPWVGAGRIRRSRVTAEDAGNEGLPGSGVRGVR